MVILDGETLTIEQVLAVATRGEAVSLAPSALDKMLRSRAVIERLEAGEAPVYGVNTGVGKLAEVRIARAELEQLQRNVVRSHACGVGGPLSRQEVRAMMLIRANVLAKGFSGIRPVVAERLCDLLNRGVTPVVPSRGSVGASGDLAPLAHIALVLIGEGEAELEGARLPGREALARAGLEPLTLHSKEGVSLVNGTQGMLAIGCLELAAAEILADTADMVCAMTTDAQRGTPRAFDERIQQLRPHPGQARSARNLVRLLEGSEIRASHLGCGRVQDAYSLRCAPQVHGAVRDTLALTLDYMAIALTALASISERRIDRLVNPMLNEDLPPFLADHPGLESGFMMGQVTAAALVAENRVLCHPASAGSITTSGNTEDFVSMGMTAALKLKQVVENTRTVLAIEALTAARALDFLRPLKSSPHIESVRQRLGEVYPGAPGDRPLSGEIAQVAGWIAGGVLAPTLFTSDTQPTIQIS